MALTGLRAEIDAVDRELVRLLDRRAELVAKVGREKRRAGMGVFVPSREAEVLRKVRSRRRRFPVEALEEIFRAVFRACRSLEGPLRIACLGPAGTYSHEAALKIFGPDASYRTEGSIAEIFRSVEEAEAEYGVVPFENTTEGVVTHTIDLFWTSPLRVVGEFFLPVSHCLLSKERTPAAVRRVYSHHQALAQARRWLEANLPGARTVEVSSTAEAARRVARMRHAAAVASEAAARIYGLRVLARDIHDVETNVTRFLVLARSSENTATGSDKTSVLFTVQDRPGALFAILSAFKAEGVNMSKIESRPVRGRPWEYFFFVDLEGHEEDAAIRRAVAQARRKAVEFRVLGSYPCATEGRVG